MIRSWLVMVLCAAAFIPGARAQKGPDAYAVNARAHAEAVKLAFNRLEDFILRRSTEAVSWSGDVPPAALGASSVVTGWLDSWTDRGMRARYCGGTLLVWLNPDRLMGVGLDHRSVHSAPRLYGRERRTLHWLDSGVAEGGDGRHSVSLPGCMTSGLPSGRAALAGAVADPWVTTGQRVEWESRVGVCPGGTHRPSHLAAADPARTERRSVTREVNQKGQVVEPPLPVFGAWALSVDLCEQDYTVTETETRSCTYSIDGETGVGYEIWTRQKLVSVGGESGIWSVLFSTCWTGTVAAIPAPAGTPEELPTPSVSMPTWVEEIPLACAYCEDGAARRWRRHTDRHLQFPWDSGPTVQTDVEVTSWITDRSLCTPTPPAVTGTSTVTENYTGGCAAGFSGSSSWTRVATYRDEIPCGGSVRTVFESATDWTLVSNSCEAVSGPGGPKGVCYDDEGFITRCGGGTSIDGGGGGGGGGYENGVGWGEAAGTIGSNDANANGIADDEEGSDSGGGGDGGGAC